MRSDRRGCAGFSHPALDLRLVLFHCAAFGRAQDEEDAECAANRAKGVAAIYWGGDVSGARTMNLELESSR